MTTASRIATASPASSAPATLIAKLRVAAGDIKLAHSVFAMPFAILAAFLARPETTAWSRFAGQLGLVIVCMVLARSWAMLFNRISDRALDAANPRTARRALAAGKLTMRDGWLIALACGIGFVIACALFFVFFGNFWPLALSVPVLGWIAFYSLTKRFTALCHVFLGGALAASPLAAAIAVHPPALMSMPVLWLLSGMVLLWVAGFDVIYALQDLEFDRTVKLHSIPAKLGVGGALWVSRALHVGAFAMLVLAASPIGREPRFGVMFLAAVGLVGVLLVCEHVVLARRGQAGLDMAFFTLNGIVSCVLGAAGVADVLL
ncbi:MAG: putative 4-hydroxybenzoate polyprenyltransferase [Phycisphaerales bacterium]|nr:putative 4-hydroxybenzoate polyprenyltransferase [Phycisphaerales bacterium]